MSSNSSRNNRKPSAPDHLVWRMLDFLKANPTEVLTRADIAVKFDVPAGQVDAILSAAVAARMLVRDEGTADGTVWRFPHGLVKSAFPAPFNPSLTAATRALQAARRVAMRVDFSTIKVEPNIPIIEAAKTGGHWTALFDRMAPGDSFQVPDRVSGAMSHAKLKYCKRVGTARFVTRKVGEGHTRIWRLE